MASCPLLDREARDGAVPRDRRALVSNGFGAQSYSVSRMTTPCTQDRPAFTERPGQLLSCTYQYSEIDL